MPGRQYTQHAPLNPLKQSNPSRPNKRKKTTRRLLNAFSIAQHSASDEYIPRRTRLGEIEGGDNEKRTRDDNSGDSDNDEDEEDDDEVQGRKRRKVNNNGEADGVERGSDSEGNEWIVGVGSQDSEINSDGVDGSVDSGDESEGFAAAAINLGDVLDGSSSDDDEDGDEEEGEDEEVRDLVDEQDDADASRLAKLRNILVSMDEKGKTQRSQLDLAQEATAPSEYGLAPKQKLSIADLMATISDPALRKSLKVLASDGKKSKLSGVPGKLSAPLPKRQQQKIDRSAAFEKSKETLSRWIETVKHNRRAEHLVFPLVDQDVEAAKSTKRILPGAPLPTNDLENTIQKILADSGLQPGKQQEDELLKFEEIAASKLPIEEARARQAELRKARDLLFREEIRAKRIKKIKSKAYRRVHRKERERNMLREKDALAEAGLLPSDDEQERMDRRRAEERMGQRHRESRWAKSIKETGRAAWDDEARDGVSAMLRQDEELKRRMHGKNADSESESDSGPLDEDEEGFTERMHSELAKLKTTEPLQQNKLSSMKFMQKAEAARKAQNQEALEQLQRELDGDSQAGSDDENDDAAVSTGRKVFGPKRKLKSAIKAKENRAEFEEGHESDNSNLEQDDVEIVVNGSGKINGHAKANGISGPKGKSTGTVRASALESISKSSQADIDGEEENPFLVIKKKSKKQAPESSIIISSEAQLSHKNSSINTTQKAKPTSTSDLVYASDSEASFTGFSPPPPTSSAPLSQQALISQAFAGDADLIQTAFTNEKANLTLSEAPSTPSLPGWGSWTGPGLSRKDKRIAAATNASRQSANSMSEGIAAEKRKDKSLERVIISEKRQPKTAKYLAPVLPHPFESKDQYERSLRLPVGPEFTTKLAFQKLTKPRVVVKGGVVLPVRRPLA